MRLSRDWSDYRTSLREHGFYFIDSEEGRSNSGREGDNLGYRTRYKEGYFPVPPSDHFQDLRTEMVLKMQSIGMNLEWRI
jgi:glutamine synthetase